MTMSSVLESPPHPRQNANVKAATAAENLSVFELASGPENQL